MSINSVNKESWNLQAKRYFENSNFSFDNVDYGDVRCLTEKDLKLLGDVKGKRILELGCGGANCGIALSKQGAAVICTDISEKQIEIAKNNAQRENVGIKFIVSAMEDVNFTDEKFDIVISICAMMYVKDVSKVFSNVSGMLNKNGIFVFSLNDPTFYSVASKYLWNEKDGQQSYFYTGEERWKWEDDDDFEFITYRRTIGDYINKLSDCKMLVSKLHQLKIEHDVINDDEELLETEYPRIMVFKSVKI